jgi:cysteine desulfurase/selenocysteine lyase
MYDIAEVRAQFPILSREVHNKKLCYLDNGASAQKPIQVIEAIKKAYSEEYSNVHRGLHYLSNLATDKYEAVRGKVKAFLNAEFEDEIIFTSGSTEGLNLISYGWALKNLNPGDEILLSVMEHHANIVPWYFLKEKIGVSLVWVEPLKDGSLPADVVIKSITPKTKMIAITHMSNVLGSVVNVKEICKAASKKGIPVVVDGSQAAVHMQVDVKDIGCDFYTITGHKLYGPSGSGAVYIKRDRMNEMQPFMGGGDMIKDVTRDFISFNKPPHKFEAGTPGIVQTIGLGVAIDFIQEVGLSNILKYEMQVRDYAISRLNELNWLHVQGNCSDKGSIFSFTVEGQGHPHDISTILDRKGVAVRAGQHCAQPLMEFLGLTATCRASFAMYNTENEVDILIDSLKTCHDLFV